MTDLRTAAQQALEALEDLADCGAEAWSEQRPCVQIGREAITALRAALAEPVQEPVAWVSKRTLDRIKDFDGTIYANGGFDDAVPLYTAPPQRKPLSEDEALDIARTFGAQPWPPGSCVAFARAVERAHGIGATHE